MKKKKLFIISKKHTSLEKTSKNWESKDGSQPIKKIEAKNKLMLYDKNQIELVRKRKKVTAHYLQEQFIKICNSWQFKCSTSSIKQALIVPQSLITIIVGNFSTSPPSFVRSPTLEHNRVLHGETATHTDQKDFTDAIEHSNWTYTEYIFSSPDTVGLSRRMKQFLSNAKELISCIFHITVK